VRHLEAEMKEGNEGRKHFCPKTRHFCHDSMIRRVQKQPLSRHLLMMILFLVVMKEEEASSHRRRRGEEGGVILETLEEFMRRRHKNLRL